MNQEDVKKALEALGGATFNIAGDFVLEKNNTYNYTIENVEAGGTVNISSGENPQPKGKNRAPKRGEKPQKPPKPRETMTFMRKPEVTEAHLKLLFMKLAQEKWISGNEADFCALFSGKRDEDCVVTWLGKYGKGTLVELFKQLVKTGLVIIPDGFTLSAILEGHFKDKTGQWLKGLDKGDEPNKKALPEISVFINLLKLKPDRVLG
jgi:hypothetical protein